MTNVFEGLDLQQQIDLRWTLRDIRAKRWKLAPINPEQLSKLVDAGLVEIRENGVPSLTNAGLDVIA